MTDALPDLPERLVGRFFRYLSIATQSDARATTLPSTPGQWDLARLLQAELEALGLSDIHLDANCVLTARLPGTAEAAPRIGFCAHLDTVDVGLSPDIRPQRIRFDGSDLVLSPDCTMRVAEHPELLPYRGQELIVTDGTSVLGADDKAAITVVMELLQTLAREKAAHGDVVVAFVPDEEIGLRGAKAMDLARFPVDFAYTIDCCAVGEFVCETFNAAQATIRIQGVTAHPMSAKGVMVNPVLVATDLIGRLDPRQTPEHTEGRDGYWWVNGVVADAAEATLTVSIRDFDADGFARRKRVLEEVVAAVAAAHPRAVLSLRLVDLYANPAGALAAEPRAAALMRAAYEQAGIAPEIIAMRGGTDGSALSARGVPTPNMFTGALNFHSPFEFLPVPSFVASYRVAEGIVSLAARSGR
ncbi:peptidase T [Acetobacteraceae bacterium KSS8]|uniref:Peptidase T n=1 Tax=Endosaccharibacter trunci TaxID=2812733 RepID=A0ABT1W8U8_9PROT|nr:peptidase T [Acetobacteraceae bacterium KSS8]